MSGSFRCIRLLEFTTNLRYVSWNITKAAPAIVPATRALMESNEMNPLMERTTEVTLVIAMNTMIYK